MFETGGIAPQTQSGLNNCTGKHRQWGGETNTCRHVLAIPPPVRPPLGQGVLGGRYTTGNKKYTHEQKG